MNDIQKRLVKRAQTRALGKKIKASRHRLKYDQDYCCSVVGCAKKSWYRWENGLSFPLPIYLPKLAELLPEAGRYLKKMTKAVT